MSKLLKVTIYSGLKNTYIKENSLIKKGRSKRLRAMVLITIMLSLIITLSVAFFMEHILFTSIAKCSFIILCVLVIKYYSEKQSNLKS